MQTHPYATPVTGARRRRAAQPEGVNAPLAQGGISEVVYIKDQPVVGHILLPLLRQLGLQSRWLLWLTSSRRLSRPWLAQSGLPLQKVVQLCQPSAFDTVAAMEKALLTGNFSVILGWFPAELSETDKRRLQNAAQQRRNFRFHHVSAKWLESSFWAVFRVKNSLNFVSLSKIRIILRSTARRPE